MTDPAPAREMPSGLSPSSIELWHQCPRRFEKEKIDRRASPSGKEAVLGTHVHRTLEILHQLPPEQRTREAAYAAAKEAWKETRESEDFKSLGFDPEAVQVFKRSGMASVATYFQVEDPTKVKVESTERRLDAVIEGVPIRGIVDRLDRDDFGDLVVTDYKNGKVPAPRFAAPKYRQLNFYGALVEAVDGELPAEGRLVFTAHAKVLSTSIDRRTVDAAVGVAVDTWSALNSAFESGRFEPVTGPLCGWCPFAAECPEGMADLRERRAAGKLKTAAPNYELAAPVEE